MKSIAALLAIFVLVGVDGTARSQESMNGQKRSVFPDWMWEFLPTTPEDRAKSATFDNEGSWLLELGMGISSTRCGFMMTGEPESYLVFVSARVCGHDAVVVGTAVPVATRLNNRGTWLYTEFAIDVRRWVHPSADASREVRALVSGGVLHTQGKTASVSSPWKPEAGREALFFLKRVAGTRAFTVAALPIADQPGWPSSLQAPLLPHEIQHNDVPFDRFIDDLAIAASRCRPAARRP